MKYENPPSKENNYSCLLKSETSREQSRIWPQAPCADDGLPLLEAACRRDVQHACRSDPSVDDPAEDARSRKLSTPLNSASRIQSSGRAACSVHTGLLALRQACRVVIHTTLMPFEVGLNMSYWTANHSRAPVAC